MTIKNIRGHNSILLQHLGLVLILRKAVQQPSVLHAVRLLNPLHQKLHYDLVRYLLSSLQRLNQPGAGQWKRVRERFSE